MYRQFSRAHLYGIAFIGMNNQEFEFPQWPPAGTPGEIQEHLGRYLQHLSPALQEAFNYLRDALGQGGDQIIAGRLQNLEDRLGQDDDQTIAGRLQTLQDQLGQDDDKTIAESLQTLNENI